jgi:hypothetical protein
MDDNVTATLTDVATATEVPSAKEVLSTGMEGSSGKSEAPSAPSKGGSAAPTPSFVDCFKVVTLADKSGIEAISALPSKLRQNWPELAKILESSAVRTKLDTFARQDAEAVRQQTYLVQEATRASACLAAVGVSSGVILAIAALSAGSPYESMLKILTVLLGIGTLLLGAAAAFFTYIARDQGRVGRWQTCRGEAELERLAVFGAIADRAAEEGNDAALKGLALVSVHLLDDQRKWLDARALRHRKSSETTSLLGGVANALAFVAGSGAIFAAQASGSVFMVLAGVVGAAIGAFSSNRDALRRDRANAERYESTEVALDQLAGRIDDVAEKIVAGQPKALVAFTDAVTDLLSTEHKQWLEGTAQAAASLQKLDAQLGQLSKPEKQQLEERPTSAGETNGR